MKFPPVGDVHYFIQKALYLREPNVSTFTLPDYTVYNLRFELNLPVRTSSLIFNLPEWNSTCLKKYHNEWFYHTEEHSSKIQLVHPGKLPKNQLARSQNLLVTDERTSVNIFTDYSV